MLCCCWRCPFLPAHKASVSPTRTSMPPEAFGYRLLPSHRVRCYRFKNPLDPWTHRRSGRAQYSFPRLLHFSIGSPLAPCGSLNAPVKTPGAPYLFRLGLPPSPPSTIQHCCSSNDSEVLLRLAIGEVISNQMKTQNESQPEPDSRSEFEPKSLTPLQN